MPSAVAVMVAEPGAKLVTSPVLETIATDGFELDQVTVRSVRMPPLASFTMATTCREVPAIRTTRGGPRVTDDTGISVTVARVVPVFPPAVAVIIADPVPMPFTSPVSDTVATDRLELDQVTVRPVRTLPPASCNVATSCCVPPNAKIVD